LTVAENMFYTIKVIDPALDRALARQIAGAVARHVHGCRLTALERIAAITDLQQAAAGRADLLGEHAGVALGLGEGRPDAARYRQIAELCIAAGADKNLMERWTRVARQRAAITAAMRTGRRLNVADLPRIYYSRK
jgi:hypothetical protein